MILIENKKYITYSKIRNKIYWKEMNIWKSNGDIWDKQEMNIRRIIESNYLIDNIYNEINRK
jgi:hypothetical protein